MQNSLIGLRNYEIRYLIRKSKLFKQVKLTGSAKTVLNCIVDYYNHKKGESWPSQNTIAEETGLLRPHVCRAVKELKKAGMILTSGRIGESLSYFFTNKFLEMIVPVQKQEKNVYQIGTPHVPKRFTPMYQNGTEEYNGKNIDKKDFSKKIFTNETPQNNNSAKKFEPEIFITESPLNFNYEQAQKYLNDLPAMLHDSYFAIELKNKWNITPERIANNV